MKAKAFYHAGITVSDLDRTSAFLQEWLGMTEMERKSFGNPNGEPWDNHVPGIKNTKTQVCFLELDDTVVELVEYPTPRGQRRALTSLRRWQRSPSYKRR